MADAFTINSTTPSKTAKTAGKTPWFIDAYSADISAAQVFRAAAASGFQYLERIVIECEALASSQTISILNDSDLQIGPTTSLLDLEYDFRDNPLKFSGAIKMSQSNAHPIHVMGWGFDA